MTAQTIQGTKAHLRPLKEDDHFRVAQIASQKSVAWATSAIPHPYPDGASEAYVRRRIAQGALIWVLDASHIHHPDVLGVIELSPQGDHWELGYLLDPAFANLGYMSAALSDLIQAQPSDADVIMTEVFQDNPSAARVLTKSGFEYVGDGEVFSIARNAIVQTWRYIYRYR